MTTTTTATLGNSVKVPNWNLRLSKKSVDSSEKIPIMSGVMNKTTLNLTNEEQMVGALKMLGTACCFVSMDTVTEPKMRKTGNPFLGVRKISTRNGLINVNFEASVARRIAASLGLKESEVEYTGGGTWYVHEETAEGKPLALCRHKTNGNHYLQYFPHKSRTRYAMPNGEPVSYEQLKPFLQEQAKSEFKPVVITLGLKSIKALRVRKMVLANLNSRPAPVS